MVCCGKSEISKTSKEDVWAVISGDAVVQFKSPKRDITRPGNLCLIDYAIKSYSAAILLDMKKHGLCCHGKITCRCEIDDIKLKQ